MNDKQKRARIMIVEAGLKRLLTGDALSRTELFVPDVKPAFAKDRDILMAEIAKKPWQRTVLDRLLKYADLEEVPERGQIFYRLTNPAKVREILDDHEEHGVMLAWYVFPNEAPEGAPDEVRAQEAPEEEDNEDPAKETAPAVVQDEAPTAGTYILLTPEQFEKLFAGYQATNQILIEAGEKIRKHLQETKTAHEAERHEAHKIAKRVSDLGTSVDELSKTQERTYKLLKDHVAVLSSFDQTAGSIVEAMSQSIKTSAELQALAMSFNVFTKEFKEQKRDRLREIAHQLEQHTQAGEALHEALLEVTANEADKP